MAREKNKTGVFKIKPAARHILTIGRDLIKDNATALLELVKNSYDADATQVTIEFSSVKSRRGAGIKISVQDNGLGMNYQTVTTVWMVPSTLYKQQKEFLSEIKQRPLQGRKGIGRYAASILGDELHLKTTQEREVTTLSIYWKDFEEKEYLDDIEISINRGKTSDPAGTCIEIIGSTDKLREWDKPQIESFIKELRRLISPIHEKDIKTDFEIKLLFKDFPVDAYKNETITIEPFPILEVFDYRISGEVSGTGEANLVFENGTAGTVSEKFKIHILLDDGAKYCGKLSVDFKIYDKDADSIENLIEKIGDRTNGSKSGEKLSKNEARSLLKQICGIAVYRGGFRIRPHGDPGYDWLQLDRRRVQKPGVRVGSDRVSGFIEIEPEERSCLEEKASRDGLKENKYFLGLTQIATRILLEAENKRYQFKLKTGQENSQRNLIRKLENLFDFSDVTQSIEKKLADHEMPKSERKKIVGLIDARVEESNKVVEDVKRIIAIYQGQATLGKIVRVVLHEGRNPLSYFQNQIPVIKKWVDELKTEFNKNLLNQLVDRLDAIKRQAELLINLFRKISPLAAQRKANPATFYLKKNLEEIIDIFSQEFKEKKIKIRLDCDPDIQVTAWPEDISQTIVNLLDNSLYWLAQNKNSARKVTITGTIMGDTFQLTYKDNGPGIEKKFIRDELIFEPGFTTKPDGTGLGLAIAGEAMERSGGKLTAVYSESGAHFEIDFPLQSKK